MGGVGGWEGGVCGEGGDLSAAAAYAGGGFEVVEGIVGGP